MTVQEAIRTMEYFDRNFGGYRPNHEAIQMAIEALEGKDTNVPSNDLISRQDAIDGMRRGGEDA